MLNGRAPSGTPHVFIAPTALPAAGREPDIPGTTDEFNAVINGFYPWRYDGGSYVTFSYGGPTTRLASNHGDTYNVVGWVDPGHMDWVALTTCSYDILNQIRECDMELNDRYLWGVNGESDRTDVRNVATHEAGHFIFLNDLYGAEDEPQTMYAYLPRGETKRRTLEWGDVAGLRFVYFYHRNPFNVGWSIQGADADLGPYGGDGRYDLLVAWVDNPSGQNYFYWRIGYDVSTTDGTVSSWSASRGGPSGIGQETQGLGVARGNIDFNGMPDVVVSYASSGGTRFRIGWDISGSGLFAGWSREFTVDRDGQPAGNGNGVGIADIWYGSANAREMVIVSIDDALFDDPVLYQWV